MEFLRTYMWKNCIIDLIGWGKGFKEIHTYIFATILDLINERCEDFVYIMNVGTDTEHSLRLV